MESGPVLLRNSGAAVTPATQANTIEVRAPAKMLHIMREMLRKGPQALVRPLSDPKKKHTANSLSPVSISCVRCGAQY